MKSKRRIFLKTNADVREFLWLEQGNDGSIYLGGTSPPRYGRKGKLTASELDEPGTPLNINGGDAMTSAELVGKHSFHKSGVINLPTISVDRRDRLQTMAFSEYEGALPLLCIIPMVPTKYPVSNKKVRASDLVIDCGLNKGKCIGVVLFVAFSEPRKELFDALREQGLSMHIVGVDLFDRKLCAMLYFNERFLGWPIEQVEVAPHPNDSGVMLWPIVVPDYETT